MTNVATSDGSVGGYQPMTLARLGELLASHADDERWLMVSEFLEEHRHEPQERPAAVRAVCADVFPDEPIPKRADLLLDELFGRSAR